MHQMMLLRALDVVPHRLSMMRIHWVPRSLTSHSRVTPVTPQHTLLVVPDHNGEIQAYRYHSRMAGTSSTTSSSSWEGGMQHLTLTAVSFIQCVRTYSINVEVVGKKGVLPWLT